MGDTKAPDPPPPYRSTPAAETTDQAMVIANLKAQNARLLAILEHMVLTGATAPAAVAAEAEINAAANTTARVARPATRFGQESLTHVTSARLKAILTESMRSAPAKAAAAAVAAQAKAEAEDEAEAVPASWISAEMRSAARSAAVPVIVAELAKLIYSVPENQPWYTLDDGILLSQTDIGWEFKTSRGEVVQISQMIYRLMHANLTPQGRTDYADIMTNIRNGRRSHGCFTHSTTLVYV